jgi:ribonuclease P protein component
MLTRENRLSSGADFAHAIRGGRRAGTRTLVLHLAHPAAAEPAGGAKCEPARVGFVVSRAIGTAVVRNLVKRRLRHLARERLASLPGSVVLVVRALPAAGEASYAELGADFDAALSRVSGGRLPGPLS